MKGKRGILHGALLWSVSLSVGGCVTELPSLVDPTEIATSVVVGRVVTVLTGETSRRYPPEVRFLELEDRVSGKRFQVEIKSHDEYFVIDLSDGQYRLTRVQISEGPFMSMANLDMTFSVNAKAITHVGTWRFGIDSPRYGRMMVASVVAGQAEESGVRDFLSHQYPTFDGRSMVEALPQPAQVEARLYEVMPYPRYPRYFRRHWW
ncbi:MAG: hypothetical protein A4E19_19180 [Nitrospira sp. SG-bin1]|nr:MAG: hypothetical protein A4E19_19180 [Nitrospira sp. SG-bin1]